MYQTNSKPSLNCSAVTLLLVIACLSALLSALPGCGSDSGGNSEAEANSRGNSEWQRVAVAELNDAGLLTAQTKVGVDSDGHAHFVYFDQATDAEISTYELKHLVWDVANNELFAGIATEDIVALDNSADIAFAINPGSDSMAASYRGGGFRECNADIQSDAMFSLNVAGSWNEYTGAIGDVERNPVIHDGLAGDDISIAIDSTGNVHIAYQFFYEGCDAMNFRYPDLKYVRKEATTLDVVVPEQMVEGNDYGNSNAQNNAGAHNELVLDANDNPAVFYYAELSNGTRGLRVAYLENNQWRKEWVETGCEVGGLSAAYHSATSEPDGFFGVAYYIVACSDLDGDGIYDTKALRYADNSSGSWLVQTVDETTKTGQFPSLSFSAEGLPAIAYYQQESYSGRELNNLYLARYYAYPDPNFIADPEADPEVSADMITGWHTETVSEIGDIGLYNTLWFDLNGKAHISSFSRTAATIYLFNEL